MRQYKIFKENQGYVDAMYAILSSVHALSFKEFSDRIWLLCNKQNTFEYADAIIRNRQKEFLHEMRKRIARIACYAVVHPFIDSATWEDHRKMDNVLEKTCADDFLDFIMDNAMLYRIGMKTLRDAATPLRTLKHAFDKSRVDYRIDRPHEKHRRSRRVAQDIGELVA